MSSPEDEVIPGRRYALCVGIGTYTNLSNRNLRYAAKDAHKIADLLSDPERGNFAVTCLTEAAQTNTAALKMALNELLNGSERRTEDLVVIYFSCHGDVYSPNKVFCLLPSDATREGDGSTFDRSTVIDAHDLAGILSKTQVQNIVIFLDACHSGGAGAALQDLGQLNLSSGPNIFFIGGARKDQVTIQSSRLEHGLFTYCLLRSFAQPPSKDDWLTISQIHNFVSDEVQDFSLEDTIQVQSWSITTGSSLQLLRNPSYPEFCPMPALCNIRWSRNQYFVGRDDILSQLATVLQLEQQADLTKRKPHALVGLGGIGKTHLVLEYAYRHRPAYHAILWVDAERETLKSSLVGIANLLGFPEQEKEDELIYEVKGWLARHAQWLLILDNVEDLALIKEILPPTFQGQVLLTTRTQVMGGLADKLEVEVMQPEIGAMLLLRRAGKLASDASLEKTSFEDAEIAKQLSYELGGLPLALDQAGAYIEAADESLQAYYQLYQSVRAALLKERGGVLQDHPELDDHPESVATTFSLAFKKIEQANSVAADLLRVCAFLQPDAIPEAIITKGAECLGPHLQMIASSQLAMNKAIAALREYSLIRRDSITHTLTIHRLVQSVLKDAMERETRKQWVQRVVLAVNAAFPRVEFEQWTVCEAIIPHAQICSQLIESYGLAFQEAADVLNKAGTYLEERARYKEAEPLFRQALHIQEEVHDLEHPSMASILRGLASTCRELGKYVESESLYERAVHIQEQGAEKLELSHTLNELAILYRERSKFGKAEALYQRALRIQEQAPEAEPLHVAKLLNGLANTYKEQSRYTESEPFFLRALRIQEQALGPEHPHVAMTLSNLAELYEKMGRYTEAEQDLHRALTILERALNPEHADMAYPLGNLASLYVTLGRYTEAEQLYVRALYIRERALGPEHPRVAGMLGGLANLYIIQRKYEEAETLYKQILNTQEQAFGSENPEIANTLSDLAYLYFVQERYTEAEQLCQRAINIQEQEFDFEHVDLCFPLLNLADIYTEQEKYEEAEPLFLRALHIREQVLGPEHLYVADTLIGLAYFYYNQNKYEEAEPLFLRALHIQEQVFGPEHLAVALTLKDLADTYYDMGKYEEAKPLYRRALDIRQQLLGPQHPDTVEVENQYNSLLRAMNDSSS